jgi:2-haloacid dehalogenase
LTGGIAAAGALLLATRVAASTRRSKFKAIAFDAFPVFDPRPVATLCEALFPGRGGELVNLWRLRQFEYTWLRTAENRYADFARVTADALAFATETLKLALTEDQRERLLRAHFELKAWPDVIPALTGLREAGLRLAVLSNLTPTMLSGCVKTAGLDGMFEQMLSTDMAQTFKPDPRAYQLGLDALNLPREEILFVAFAGWDAAGAKAFGYPTFWVNRLGLPTERLDAAPDATGATLTDLLAFIG